MSGRADVAKGHPSNPMSYDEAAEKFQGCAGFAKEPRAKTDAVIDMVRTLDTSPDVSKLAAALTTA